MEMWITAYLSHSGCVSKCCCPGHMSLSAPWWCFHVLEMQVRAVCAHHRDLPAKPPGRGSWKGHKTDQNPFLGYRRKTNSMQVSGGAQEQNLKGSSMRFPTTLIKLTPKSSKIPRNSAGLDVAATELQLAGEVAHARANLVTMGSLRCCVFAPTREN